VTPIIQIKTDALDDARADVDLAKRQLALIKGAVTAAVLVAAFAFATIPVSFVFIVDGGRLTGAVFVALVIGAILSVLAFVATAENLDDALAQVNAKQKLVRVAERELTDAYDAEAKEEKK